MHETENYAAVYVPTWRERFWRKMGFCFHYEQEPDPQPGLVGWMKTVSRIDLSIADRLRLLLTGRLEFSTTCEFDSPSPSIVTTRLDWQIKAPGEK